jgi:UDP-N-acetylglucosamine diphosphorylase/glucosamine-1-phosphate N-acetyltransferase
LKVCVFEDEKYDLLYPLTLTRATFELRCGSMTLVERISRTHPGVETSFFLRDYLAPVLRERLGDVVVNSLQDLSRDDAILVNGRWLPEHGHLPFEKDEVIAMCKDDIVYIHVKRETVRRKLSDTFQKTVENLRSELSVKQVDARMVEYPWHLIQYNHEMLKEDFEAYWSKQEGAGSLDEKVAVVGEKSMLHVSKNAVIHPFVVLDTSSGPIIVDEDARIYPFSRVEGPCYIGRNTWIVRGNIREETTIGPVCRVGGEVEASIIHGYSNKYHTGFLGHAYVGEWVNIGALTTNSDLKNDYSNVDVYVKGRLMDTGDLKVGSFIGDHTKFGIGCLLNTGTVVGVACVLLGGEVLPKYIPSFCWYAEGRLRRGAGFRRTVEAEKRVMSRRSVVMSESYVRMLEKIYQDTREERETLIRKAEMRMERGGM